MGLFKKIKDFLGFKPADKDDNDLYKKELEKGVKEKPKPKLKKDEVLVRRFGGKISGFKDNAEANFEKKHLKAYLKGDKYFRHGFKDEDDIRVPAYHKVKEEWKKVKKQKQEKKEAPSKSKLALTS